MSGNWSGQVARGGGGVLGKSERQITGTCGSEESFILRGLGCGPSALSGSHAVGSHLGVPWCHEAAGWMPSP